MPRLYRYPLSSVWGQTGKFGNFMPIYYSDVVPGEALHGHARVKFISDSLQKAALNRLFFDVFFFYVPFRLLWSDFPAFISGDDTVGVPPVLNQVWVWNYEGANITNATGGVGNTHHAAWQRYAYNYVYNHASRS